MSMKQNHTRFNQSLLCQCLLDEKVMAVTNIIYVLVGMK